MAGILVGYARASTYYRQAGLDAQLRDLKSAGCEEIPSEQISAGTQRGRCKETPRFVHRGDNLVVCKPDRLARSTTGSCGSSNISTVRCLQHVALLMSAIGKGEGGIERRALRRKRPLRYHSETGSEGIRAALDSTSHTRSPRESGCSPGCPWSV